jgi:hypothetical protein
LFEPVLVTTRCRNTGDSRGRAPYTRVSALYVGAYHALRARVQSAADADPENAEAIITSAGFAVRKTTIRQKQTFAVKYGPVSGTIHVTAPSSGPRASYEWQSSVDGGKTWMQAANTLQAKTTFVGLPVATTVEFRFRVTTKTGMGDWSQPTSILVR